MPTLIPRPRIRPSLLSDTFLIHSTLLFCSDRDNNSNNNATHQTHLLPTSRHTHHALYASIGFVCTLTASACLLLFADLIYQIGHLVGVTDRLMDNINDDHDHDGGNGDSFQQANWKQWNHKTSSGSPDMMCSFLNSQWCQPYMFFMEDKRQ